MEEETEVTEPLDRRWLLLPVLAALLLRLPPALGDELTWDETFTLRLIQQPMWTTGPGSLWESLLSGDPHPPGYYLSMKAWMSLGFSDGGMRVPGILIALVVTWVTGRMGARWGGSFVGFLSAWLVAVNPLFVPMSAEGRMYAPLTLLLLLGVHAALPYLREGRPPPARTWGFTAAAMYVHYLVAFPLAALFLVSRAWREPRRLWPLVFAAPLGLLLVTQLGQGHAWAPPWKPAFGALTPYWVVHNLASGFRQSPIFPEDAWFETARHITAGAFLILALLGACFEKRPRVLGPFLFVTVVLILGAAYFKTFWNARYAVFLSPYYLVLVAGGVAAVGRVPRARTWLGIGVVVGSALVNLQLASQNPPPAWEQAAEYIELWAGRETPVLVCIPDRMVILEHYLGTRSNVRGAGPWDVPAEVDRHLANADRMVLVLYYPEAWDPSGKVLSHLRAGWKASRQAAIPVPISIVEMVRITGTDRR